MRAAVFRRPTRLTQAVLIALLCGSGSAWAQSAATPGAAGHAQHTVDIAVQPLSAALDSLASQTGLQFVYPSQGLPPGMQSPRISGRVTIDEALERMLSPLGMAYEFVNPKTVSIRQMNAQELAAGTHARADDMQAVVVTGTNLTKFDPASPVIILDAEQLQRRGNSSIEDVLRSLPQNLSTRTSMSAALGQVEFGQPYLPSSPIGNTSINLRGMGSASTLVLVNGRRPATSAQESGGFTDISSIPLSQVDYIEILTDGASAIYGADAVAGVVNIVLKKNYEGTNVQIRREKSSTRADAVSASIGHSFGWGSGTLTVMAGIKRSKATDLSGFIRSGPMGVGDFTAEGGTNTRQIGFGSPGAVYSVRQRNGQAYLGAMLGYIPLDQTGNTLKPGDLLSPATTPTRSIYEYTRVGPETEHKTVRLEGRQNLGNAMELNFGIGYSGQRNKEIWQPTIGNFYTIVGPLGRGQTLVPSSNLHNPFGRNVAVSYSYAKELAGMRFDSNQAQTNIDAHVGLTGKLPWLRNWHFDTGLSYGAEDGRTDALGDDNGGTLDPSRTRKFYQNVNPFGNGTDAAIVAANRKLLEELVQRKHSNFSSRAITWDGLVRGDLFSLPAGKVEMALGAQLRREKNRYFQQMTDPSNVQGGYMSDALSKSTRDSEAAFTEIGFPLLKDVPFAKELSLTLAARYERFKQTGDSSLLAYAPLYDPDTFDLLGDLTTMGGFNLQAITGTQSGVGANIGPTTPITRSYSNTSPLARLSWKPFANLRLRTTWGRSFVTPNATQLFGLMQAYDATYSVSKLTTLPPGVDYVISLSGPNRDLKPQVATTQTYGLDYSPGFVPGLNMSLTYTNTIFKNYIAAPGDILSVSQIFQPGAALPPGTLTLGQKKILLWDSRSVNYLGRTSRSIDFTTSYLFTSKWGDWRIDLNAVRMLELSVRSLKELPKVMVSGTESGPSKWAADLQVAWDYRNVYATLGAHYTSGFQVVNPLSADVFNDFPPNPTPRRHAGSYLTFDSQMGYRPQSNQSWLKGLNVSLGAQNLLNRRPAFVDNQYGFLVNRANPRGRVVYLDIRKEF